MLNWIPERIIEWQLDEDGKVFLLKEKSRRRWMKWMIDRVGKSQFFRIHLDDFGSRAWQLADGKCTLSDISTAMKAEFGASLADADKRICVFFSMLAKHGFVRLLKSA